MNRAEVFVLGGRDVGRSFVVADGTVFGRDSGCDVRLGDRSISRQHARLRFDGLVWRVEDLGSRNGLSVDGERVSEAKLRDRDEFTLGEVPLRFRLAEEDRATAARVVEAPEADLGDEIVLEGEHEEPPPRAVPSARVPAAAPTAEDGTPPAAPPSRLRTGSTPAREGGAHGLLRGDFEQQPLWVRGLSILVLLAAMAGIVFAVFRLVQGVRSTL